MKGTWYIEQYIVDIWCKILAFSSYYPGIQWLKDLKTPDLSGVCRTNTQTKMQYLTDSQTPTHKHIIYCNKQITVKTN